MLIGDAKDLVQNCTTETKGTLINKHAQGRKLDSMSIENLYNDAVRLLEQLIAIPSFSKEEDKTADLLMVFRRKEYRCKAIT